MEPEQHDLVEGTRARLEQARTREELRRMLLAAAPLFHQTLRRRTLRGSRPELKLRVQSLGSEYSGLLIPHPQEAYVFLNDAERSTRRRYTLAHELGHSLLAGADRARVKLDRAGEERMCDAFAKEALMPAEELRRYFSTTGFPQSREQLLEFCKYFLVGISAAVNALSSLHDPKYPVALIAASHRYNTTRSPEVTLRVDASSAPGPMLAPKGKRLRSLGLLRLLWWMKQIDEAGVEGCGEEQRVLLRSLRPGVAGWTGPARWSAWTVNGPRTSEPEALAVVVLLDASRLRPLPTAGRRSRESQPSLSAIDTRQERLSV